jgi:hypothetical protein
MNTYRYSGPGGSMDELEHFKMCIDRVDEYYLNYLNPELKANWEQDKVKIIRGLNEKELTNTTKLL